MRFKLYSTIKSSKLLRKGRKCPHNLCNKQIAAKESKWANCFGRNSSCVNTTQEIITTIIIEISPTVLEYFTKKSLVRKMKESKRMFPRALKESQGQSLGFLSFWSSLVWYSTFFLNPVAQIIQTQVHIRLCLHFFS